MKILGADTLVGEISSLDNIKSLYVFDGDFAIVKNGEFSSFYYLSEGSGVEHNPPFIIQPRDSTDAKRWVLMGMTADSISSDIVSINTLSSMTDSPSGVIFSDPVTFTENVTFSNPDTPFTVATNTLIPNLNAEFLDGNRVDELPFTQRGEFLLSESPSGSDEPTPDYIIPFDHDQQSVDYLAFMNLQNITDEVPSLYSYIIVEKALSYFRVRFSGRIDSGNYNVMWMTIENVIDNQCGIYGDSDPLNVPSFNAPVGASYPLSGELSPLFTTNVGCFISATFNDIVIGMTYNFSMPVGSGIHYSGETMPHKALTTDPITVVYRVASTDTNGQVQMLLEEYDGDV